MLLKDIQTLVQDYFKVDDITVKGRKGEVVEARRLAIWYAREKGYRYYSITEAWGFGHDVGIYHNKYINNMIRLGHRQTTDDIWNVFNLDVTKDMTKEKLQRIHNSFDSMLMSCPDSDLSELIERVGIMVKAYNHTHVPRPTEVILSNALKLE